MPRGKEFRGGQYGNTRGKEKKGTAAARRANDPRYVAAMEQARADQKALDDLIAKQKLEPAVGPVAGAMHAAERKKAEDAAAASQALVLHKEVHMEVEAAAEPAKPEPVVKAPKAFVPKPFGWRKKLPEFGDESKQESFALTTARIMAKTGYNIEHICNTTHVGWGDLIRMDEEWDEDGYLIFDLGGDDGSAEGD